MEFPWDDEKWKRNSRGQVKNQQGIFQGIATNGEINKEIPRNCQGISTGWVRIH